MMLQLDPTIPMMTSRGSGYALFVVDYSQEHHLMWVVALDDGGAIWMFENPDVRVQSTFTLGRRPDRAFGMRTGPAAAGATASATPRQTSDDRSEDCLRTTDFSRAPSVARAPSSGWCAG
jgi:hypothetical protein